MARRCVWSRNLENEEAKARYWVVKIQPQWVVTPGKQTVLLLSLHVEINLNKRTICVRFVAEKVALKQESNRRLFWESYEIHKCTLGRMHNLLMLLLMVLIFTVGLQTLNYFFQQVQLECISRPDTFWFYSHLKDENNLALSRRKNNWIILKLTERGDY